MIRFPGKNDLNIPLEDVLYRIEHADHMEIDKMLQALRLRYSHVFPDWELMILSVKVGDEKERRESVRQMVDFLQKHYLREI